MVGHPRVRLFDKKALKEELMSQLRATLDRSRAAHAAATEGATHSEARPENDKDTRGLELSYLARGQAQRVAELQIVLGAVSEMRLRPFLRTDAISVGALVRVEEDGSIQDLLFAEHGGGVVLSGDVHVVTPNSPLGRALLGRHEGDEVEVRLPGRVRVLSVSSIS